MNKILTFLLSVISVTLYAQTQATHTTQAQFETHMYDFGLLTAGDEATYSFTFLNTGKDTLRLTSQNVRTSGSTAMIAEYSASQVLPGEKGALTVRLRTADLTGSFNKSVYYIEKGNMAVLTVMGVIQPKVNTTAMSTSAFTIDKTSYDFGRATKGIEMKAFFKIKNTSKDTLRLSGHSGCYCLKHSLKVSEKEVDYLLPGKSGIMEVIYNPTGIGVMQNNYVLTTNSAVQPVITLQFQTEIIAPAKEIK